MSEEIIHLSLLGEDREWAQDEMYRHVDLSLPKKLQNKQLEYNKKRKKLIKKYIDKRREMLRLQERVTSQQLDQPQLFQKYLKKIQNKDWEEVWELRHDLEPWFESKPPSFRAMFFKDRMLRVRLRVQYQFPKLSRRKKDLASLGKRLMKQLDELEELYVEERNEIREELEGLQDEFLERIYHEYLKTYIVEEIRELRDELETSSKWFRKPTQIRGLKNDSRSKKFPIRSEETSYLKKGVKPPSALSYIRSRSLRSSWSSSSISSTSSKQVGEAEYISHEGSPSSSFMNVGKLQWMCKDVLRNNQIVWEERPSDTSTWSVSMQKDFKCYVGVRVHHKGAVLQAPGSEVILSIPSGLKAFVMGHIHTDPKPFLHAIPDDECLVAPIVDYTCMFKKRKSKASGTWFKISVPHCITNKKHLLEVRVRHGDIYKGVEFSRVPSDDCLFEVDEHHITIFTRRFSQFICTVCRKECQGSARAFIFGGLTPLTLPPVHSSLRVYMCSPLYRINDYRQKLQEIEGRLQTKRHLVDESDVTWNPDETQEELCVAVQSNWDPRQPTKMNQEWDQRTRKLVQKMRASEMLDMQLCHICKTDPSEVANFSFTVPPPTNGPQVALKFSGRLEMTTRDHGVLMESDFDVIQNELRPAAKNDDHLRLRRVTKLVISTELELVDFGLGLGCSFDQIKQKRTNHSTSIENAGMDVVVEWWDTCPERYERKVEFLVKVVDEIGKSKLIERVREMMRKIDDNNNIPCAEEGASQISLPVPEMLPVQSTTQVTRC